jgi:hypothetical protein
VTTEPTDPPDLPQAPPDRPPHYLFEKTDRRFKAWRDRLWPPRPAHARDIGVGYLLAGLSVFVLVGFLPLLRVVLSSFAWIVTFGGQGSRGMSADLLAAVIGLFALAIGHFMSNATYRLRMIHESLDMAHDPPPDDVRS